MGASWAYFLVCELRIVLLGKNVLENNRVGNFILGRAAFDTESPPVSVDHHSERVRGQVEGRPLSVINTPDLFKLRKYQLCRAVKECVSLSAPGPHVILLVLQTDSFTEEDRENVKVILNSFSDQAINYTILITTDKQVTAINNSAFQLLRECRMRQYKFELIGFRLCFELLEKIDSIVRENVGGYLICDVSEATEYISKMGTVGERSFGQHMEFHGLQPLGIALQSHKVNASSVHV
ncbi:GTPase IMAP family member 6-like [Chanos chanos]|uniref:GTPase IMAP family member 6-like n=1 Tax=Chanos chanos TaxID=29144 RepID=A0A6J2WY25_CHACN|nr:GTPase IMAP family member 6-like [Chanos chanos]